MVEHRAVPGATNAQGNRGDQTGARARDQARSSRCGSDPADADQRAQDVTNLIGFDWDKMAEGNCNDVE